MDFLKSRFNFNFFYRMEQRIDPYNINQEPDHLIDEYLLNEM